MEKRPGQSPAAVGSSSQPFLFPAVLAGVVAALAVTVLVAMERPLWCACGGHWLISTEVWSRHNSQHLFDAYSFSHIQHGMIFFALMWWLRNRIGKPLLWLALMIESLWEFIENTSWIINKYRSQTMALDYAGDTIANSFGDIVSCGLGFYLCSRLPWRVTLVLYLTLELTMLFTIRDNLSLNIVMLVYPIKALKAWQMEIAPAVLASP